MRPHSVNYYVLIIALSGLLLLGLIGLNMMQEIRKIEQTFAKSHTDSAMNELQRGINITLSRVNDIADQLVTWDETSQQLTDPTYYLYWRQTRVHNVQRIPKYVNSIELYKANGKALLEPRDKYLPPVVPDEELFVRLENNKPWLCIFKPIFLQDNSTEIFGYLGMKIEFFPALLELNLFSHIDISSMKFGLTGSKQPKVLPEKLINHIHAEEMHTSELDQLKNVTYVTFSYIVGLVLLILIILYWMMLALFAKPLTYLNQHINSIENNSTQRALPDPGDIFTVNEISNLANSLHDYQLRLDDSQNNLLKLNDELEERVKSRTNELQVINKELEAFSYSVSHDLRAPLRSIDGFSQAILDDYGDTLDKTGKDYLERVRSNAQHMAKLIDDMLDLSRITRVEFKASLVNLSQLAKDRLQVLQDSEPERLVKTHIEAEIYTQGDEQLLTILLDNLLNNAWKYSSKTKEPVIEFGCQTLNNERVYFVKDNGVGFDTQYTSKIFKVFERLHDREFEGTGIGLATVHRIVNRHHGRIWAESKPGKGATFFFALNCS